MRGFNSIHARYTLSKHARIIPWRFFTPPVKYAGNLSLTGHKTSPSVMPRLLHAAATEVWHEKDVLTSPEEQDTKKRSRPVAAKPVVTHVYVLYIQFRQYTVKKLG